MLEDGNLRGAHTGVFAVSPDNPLAALSVRRARLDNVGHRTRRREVSIDDMIDRLLSLVVGRGHLAPKPAREASSPLLRGWVQAKVTGGS